MLLVENVTWQYLGADRASIRNAAFSLSRKTINLLWGDNGAGKSTLALILCGAIPHVIEGTFSGCVSWNDSPISKESISKLSSFVFQNPYTYFQGYTIQEELDLVISPNRRLVQVAETLLPEADFETPLHKLSLGQQQRVALYSAVLRTTPLIFLDEPFESLDESGVKQAIELIKDTADENRAIVVIHRPQRREIPITFDKGYEVSDGRVSEGLPQKTKGLPPMSKPQPGSTALVIRDLSFAYSKNDAFALSGINLCILEGESVGLIGPNGCGKTTLLLVASGLLNPTSGKILLGGKPLKGKALRRSVRCAFQNPEAQLFGNTVREELEFGLLNLELARSEIVRRLDRVTDHLPFELSKDPFSLSYGQKKILSIVSTFLMEPKLILLDEPTAGLDTKNVLTFQNLAESFLRNGGSLLISSHSMPDINAFCHRALSMKHGELVNEYELQTN